MKYTGRIAATILLLALLTFGLQLNPTPAHASNSLLRTEVKTVFTAQSIAATISLDSLKFTAIGQSEHLAVQFRGVPAGGSASYTVQVKCSIDETTFVVPEAGGTVGTFTDSNWHVAAITVPFCKQVQLTVTNNATPNAVAMDAILAAQ